MNSVPSSSKDCLVRFSFKNGDEDLQMETGFDKLSEMVAKRIRECGENPGELLIEIDKEWSRLHIELMNKFTKKFFEKHAKALDRCERSEDKSKFWMDFVTKNHVDFTEIFADVHKDDLICAGNAADFFKMPSFIHLFGYEMAKRTDNMSLAELREYLNEEDDFSARERRFIKSLGI